MKSYKIFLVFWLALCALLPCSLTATIQTITFPSTSSTTGIAITITYDNFVCLGSTATFTWDINTDNYIVPSGLPPVGQYALNDFAPDSGPALFDGTAMEIPPIIPGSIFDPAAASSCHNGGMGTLLFLAVNSPNADVPPFNYFFEVTALAGAVGFQSWTPCLQILSGGVVVDQFNIGTITVFVASTATVNNVTLPDVCEGISDVTGFLTASGTLTGSTAFTVGPATGGTVTLLNASSGLFDFSPTPGFSRFASFNYNVMYSGPAANPGFCPAQAAGTVFIPVDPLPIAGPVFATGCANVFIMGSAAASVTGGLPPYTFSGPIGAVIGGTASMDASGNFGFTAASGFSGPGSFVYEVSSTTGATCSATGLVTVQVNSVPAGIDQTVFTCENTPINVTVTAIGGDGDYTFFFIAPASGGTVAPPFLTTTGEFTFIPNTGVTGPGFFNFGVFDSNSCISPTAFTVTVNIDSPPTTSSTSINGCEDTTLTGNLSNLVTGGTGPQVFTQVGPAPTCGAVLVLPDGSFIFSPNLNSTGSCFFNYQVIQGGCTGTGPSTVSVTILSAPQVTGEVFDICSGAFVTGNLNTLVISSTGTTTFTGGPGINGNLTLESTGPFTFVPTIGSGVAGFPFQALSSVLPCPSPPAMVTVNVHPFPITTTGSTQACAGNPKSGNLNSLVSGQGPFTFSGPLSEVNGVVTISPGGLYTFTPNVGATEGSFSYGVTSAFGCPASGTVLVSGNSNPTAAGETTTSCFNGQATGSLVPL